MAIEFEELSSLVLGVAVEVHKTLGPGFLETIYQRAMEVALTHRGIPFERQKEVHISFEGVEVGYHKLDLIVGDEEMGFIIIELKAVKTFEDIHFAQVKSYLKATGIKVGLLLNFNATTLSIKRVVLR
jgi:GxxExxY protein